MHPLQLVEGRGLKTSEKFLQGGGQIFLFWWWGGYIVGGGVMQF